MYEYIRVRIIALGIGLVVSAIVYLSDPLASSRTSAENLDAPIDGVVSFRVNRVKMFLNVILGVFPLGITAVPYVFIFGGRQSVDGWILFLCLGWVFPYVLFLELRTIARFVVPDILTIDERGFSIKRLGRIRNYAWSQVGEPRVVYLGYHIETPTIEISFSATDKRPLKIVAGEYRGDPERMLSVMLHKYRRAVEH